jgi:hypothetical protein
MRCFRPWAMLALAIVGCLPQVAGGAPGQNVQDRAAFRSEVTLVPLNVRVLDRHGNPVADLTKDDFSIFEDGVPQGISHFERRLPTSAEPGTGALGGASPAQNRRVFLIVLGPFANWLPNTRGSEPLVSGHKSNNCNWLRSSTSSNLEPTSKTA